MALTVATPAVADEDAKLAAFFKTYLEEVMKNAPLDATRLGDHRYDDRLDDLSPPARAANLARHKDALARLPKEVAFDQLSSEGKVDYQILRDSLTRTIWLAENTNPFEDDPRAWNEYLADSVYLVLAQTTLEKSRSVRDAASRITFIPKVVLAAKESLKTPPRVFVETAIKQNRGSIAFYESGIFALTGETPAMAAWPARASQPRRRSRITKSSSK